jgi:hypothetical protein
MQSEFYSGHKMGSGFAAIVIEMVLSSVLELIIAQH